MFFTEVLSLVKQFRDMDVDFGIVPSPKFDENQENYVQFVDSWCPSPVVIPKTAKDVSRSAFLVQLLAETGREFIRDEYYDRTLTGKSLRDDESSEMLGIIFDSYILDNAAVYAWGGLSDALRNAMSGTEGLASLIASYKTKCEATINETIEAYKSQN